MTAPVHTQTQTRPDQAVASGRAELFSANKGLVHSMYLRYGRHHTSPADEDDALQVGRMALDRAARRWNPRHASAAKFSTYACHGIIRAFRRLNGRRTRVATCQLEAACHAPVFDAPPESEAKEAVEYLMADLTDRQREVIVLRFYERMGFKEIAELLGISKQAAHIRHEAALRIMREKAEEMR